MKKLTLFLAAALLAASFAACGNSGASSSTAPEPTAIPDDILNAPATKPDPDMEIDPGSVLTRRTAVLRSSRNRMPS